MCEEFTKECFKAGKKFERDFAHQYRLTGRRLIRLSDEARNKPPCDYFAITRHFALFLELKSTGLDELPLINLRPHQIQAMGLYDDALPGMHAGFVIQFRSTPNNMIYYLSGKDMLQYVQSMCRIIDNNNLRGHVLSGDYLYKHGILIPTHRRSPRARKYTVMDIEYFLAQLQQPQTVSVKKI